MRERTEKQPCATRRESSAWRCECTPTGCDTPAAQFQLSANSQQCAQDASANRSIVVYIPIIRLYYDKL
jgi:hypothetical protein